jgi:HAE1 family hydrophobic/amphiphilic exporter-1
MSNPSRLFIEKSVMTMMIAITCVFLGILSYFQMPISDMPDTEFPAILVNVSYPGATPSTMESSVVVPLENELMTVEGLKAITSTSKNGSCAIAMQFELSRPIDFAAQDVSAAINRAAGRLPSDLPNPPTYEKVNPADLPIVLMHVTSETMSDTEIYDYTQDVISRRISMVEGVAQLQTFGSPFAVRVRLNPRLLAARDVGLEQIYSTVTSGNTNQPTGNLYGKSDAYSLLANGQLFNGPDFGSLVVKQESAGQLRLRDLGTVVNGKKNDKIRIDLIEGGKHSSATFLAIQKQVGYNTISVTKNILQTVSDLKNTMPSALKLEPYFVKANWIYEAIADVELTLFVAFALVILVVYFSLGSFTNTLVPLFVLPTSLLATLICMHILGYSLNILSLFAVTLSIGFLVDDSIIVVENIHRYIEEGKSPYEAAIEGSAQISMTVISTSLALGAVFIPMLLMGGVLGRLFHQFVVTILLALFFSAFFSLTLGALLCSRWMKDREATKSSRIQMLADKLNERMLSLYKPTLDWALKNHWMVTVVGIGCVLGTAGAGSAIPKDFFPEDDLGILTGIVIFPENASPAKQMETQQKINQVTYANPAVEKLASLSGQNPMFSGNIYWPLLKPLGERAPAAEVIGELYKSLAEVVGVKVALTSYKLINLDVGTSQSQGDYYYTLSSLDADALYKTAETFTEKLRAMHGFTQVTNNLYNKRPEVTLKIDRDKAAALGISAGGIEQALGLAFANAKSSTISTSTAQYDVIIEVLPEFYNAPTDLRELYVTSSQGDEVPLSAISEWKVETGPLTINHLNGLPAVNVYFNLEPGFPLGDAVKTIENMAGQQLLPGVEGSLQGTAGSFASSHAQLIIALAMAIFAIYAILSILYGSFIHPLTPLAALPSATIGGFLTLLLFGYPFSIYAFVGMIMLIGIVMKNGIMMIEFANELLAGGKSTPLEAIHQAALIRFRPILMTTFSTIMGAIPIAVGVGGSIANSRKPLGLVIVGGLVISQILTLYLIPVCFLYFERMRRWGLSLRGKMK